MPLTSDQAFKLGFLSRCAGLGLTEPQMLKAAQAAEVLLQRAAVNAVREKHAILGMETLSALGGKALGSAASYGIPLALLAPPLLGGAAGYGLAKATDISDRDVDDIKNDELVDELERQTKKLEQHRLSRDQIAKPSRSGRPLL